MNATAPGQRGVDNPMHLYQQHVGSIVLSVGDSNLDGITERQHVPPLARVVRREIPPEYFSTGHGLHG